VGKVVRAIVDNYETHKHPKVRVLSHVFRTRRFVEDDRRRWRSLSQLSPHSPDDALICATITPIQIRA
jgi:hypothetical protein